ncbi:MFS transporter [Campylobacter sp. RM16188]|uniref:MFS transporter n=1 Tax=Campylobacter sp. RM16188 TaxID=1705725 RepID=UPI003463AB95
MAISSKRTIKTMGPLFVGISFLFIGNGLVISSAGIELKIMGAGELATGLVIAAFFIGAMLSTIMSHKIVSKVGHIRSFAIFSSLFGISAMFHELSSNLYFWSLLRGCLGFCYYSILMIVESWLNERARNEVRSRVIAFYEIVFYVCFGLGILVLSLDLSSSEIFLISAAFILISSIPLNLVRIKEPPIPERKNISIPKIFALVPLALITSIVAGVLVNGFFSMASVYILLQGFSPKEVSFFMTIAMAGGFIAHGIIGGISDKFGRRPVIIGCSLVSLAAAIIFVKFDLSINLQYALSFFLGSGVFCLYALALARANDMLVHKSKSIEVGRAILFSYSIGSLFSPVIMGVVMSFYGASGFMWVYVVLLTLLILFALTQKTVPEKYRKSFEHSPGTMANS